MNAITQAETTALTLPERAAVAIGESANAAKLRELASQSAGILAVTNPDGRTEAHRAGMLLARTRTNITTAGKAAREDATAFSKAVIALEKDLVAIIEPEEKRVLALRDAFDEQLAAEKAAKVAAERARTDAIDKRIAELANLPAQHAMTTAAELADVITEYDGWVPDVTFEEEAERAAATVAASLVTLRDMLTARQQSEAAEAKRIADAAAEAERLAAEKLENARVKAENERIANEQAIERQRLAALAEAQEKAAAKLREEAAANLKAEQEAQAKVAAGVKAQLEAQQAAIAEQARKLAEQQAAADARDAAALAAAQDAQRREDDHGPALLMNAEFDAAREAERARLQALADQAEADSRATASLEDLLDQVDAGEISITDIPVGDEEIIALVMEVFTMDRGATIDRLQAIDFVAAREVAA